MRGYPRVRFRRALSFLLVAPALAFAAGVFALERPAAAAKGEPLDDKEADRVLDGIFARAAKITRLQARLTTTKKGSGFFKRATVSHELLQLEAPDLVRLLSFGSRREPPPLERCGLLIMDGRYLWELDPREEGEKTRLATRRRWKSGGGQRRATGLAGVLSYVVLGGEDVRSAAELRRRFRVSALRESLPGGGKNGRAKITYHFLLQRREAEQSIELWIEPGRTIPWKIRTTERRKLVGAVATGGKPRYRLHVEERVLEDVRTNLTGLPPFPVETFIFPLAPDIQVDDADSGRDNLDHKQLARELALARERIARARAERGGAKAGTGKGDGAVRPAGDARPRP